MRIWRVVAILVAALLTLTLLDRFVLVQLLARRLWLPALIAAFVALASIGTGALARRMRGDVVTDFVVGYPIFGTLCFLVGLLKVSEATLGALVTVFALLGIYTVWTWAREPLSTSRTVERPYVLDHNSPFLTRAASVFGLFAVVAVLLAGFVSAQAPPNSLDELAYHLAIPHTWVQEGRAIDLPLISHSYFPLGIESADLPLLALLGPESGGIASHLLHLLAALATVIVVLRACGQNWLLTAAIVTTPALALTTGWSLVDWPLLAICVVFADALIRKHDGTIVAALAAGLLTKYTFIPFAIIALAATRRTRGVVAGVAAGSVFFIRNLLLTGNPIAPFFSADAPHVAGYRALTLGSYVFDGRFIDESLGASLLSSAFLTTSILGFVALGAGVLLFALAPSARLLVPFFGVAATKASAEVERSPLMRAVLVVAIAAQLMLVAYYVDRSEAFSLISGRAGEAEYLARTRPSYGAVAWLNAALPETSRTLVVGLNETYWFQRRVRGGGNFDGPRISRYLGVPTPEALRERLRADGITHVAVIAAKPNTSVTSKIEERSAPLSREAQRALAQTLDRYASNVTARGDVTLFALR